LFRRLHSRISSHRCLQGLRQLSRVRLTTQRTGMLQASINKAILERNPLSTRNTLNGQHLSLSLLRQRNLRIRRISMRIMATETTGNINNIIINNTSTSTSTSILTLLLQLP
jgi:hypothetical protein